MAKSNNCDTRYMDCTHWRNNEWGCDGCTKEYNQFEGFVGTPIQEDAFLQDDMYLPIYYKGILVKQPFFEGKGNHSIMQLEAMCEQFKEYCHQQQIIKQNCMQHIVELRNKNK